MKITTLFVTTILAGGLLTAYPAMAFLSFGAFAEGLLSDQPEMEAQNDNGNMTSASAWSGHPDRQTQSDMASKVLAHISMADIALVFGMYDDASHHISNARKKIRDFNNQMAITYTSTGSVIAGKLSYSTPDGDLDYWIPIVNGRFSINAIDGKLLSSKDPDVDVTDAQIVHYKMMLDTKAADDQLAKAQIAMDQKRYDLAMNALQNISKGAISETEVEDRPLEAVRDNLILSRELLQDNDYRGASFALKHANAELSQYEKASPDDADIAKTEEMHFQIYTLRASIDDEEPSALKTAEAEIDGWIEYVKAKL
jgi:hypothetical protein